MTIIIVVVVVLDKVLSRRNPLSAAVSATENGSIRDVSLAASRTRTRVSIAPGFSVGRSTN